MLFVFLIGQIGFKHPWIVNASIPLGVFSYGAFILDRILEYWFDTGLTIQCFSSSLDALTHWGRVTHICVSKLIMTVSHNGLAPSRRQVIIWTSVGILLIGPLGTHFSEILFEIHTFSFKRIHLKMSSGKWQPFCLGPSVLRQFPVIRLVTTS